MAGAAPGQRMPWDCIGSSIESTACESAKPPPSGRQTGSVCAHRVPIQPPPLASLSTNSIALEIYRFHLQLANIQFGNNITITELLLLLSLVLLLLFQGICLWGVSGRERVVR